MAKTSLKVKQKRPAKFSTQRYNRCDLCGRVHALLPQVPGLPPVLPEARVHGPHPGRPQGVLVSPSQVFRVPGLERWPVGGM